jgi:hypothetical protein
MGGSVALGKGDCLGDRNGDWRGEMDFAQDLIVMNSTQIAPFEHTWEPRKAGQLGGLMLLFKTLRQGYN